MASRSAFGERRSSSHRFLPPDPRVAEPYRFTPQLAVRVGVLGAVALAIFAVLLLRLWALQVLSGDRYLVAAQQNQVRTLRVEAPRGSIVDRKGRSIVTNVPGTAVQLWPADMPEQGRYQMVQRLAALLQVPPSDITKAIEARKGDPLTPITVKSAVSEERVAYLEEHRSEFLGVEVVDTYLRHYEHKTLAAQILGYVREIDEQELERKNPVDDYRAGDKIGKAGVEAAYDTYLRGVAGTAQIRVDSLGRPQSALQPQEVPTPGHDVRLTLDLGLQRAAERALTFGINEAIEHENWYANGGAVVALDPRDGAILALASNPTYRPSIFTGRIDPGKIKALADPDANIPQINRAIAGLYAPGSTFKPVTALAAIETGLISPYETIQCTPEAFYGKDRQRFKNWNPNVNEPMNLPTALAASCDTYFYAIGNEFYELPADRGQPLQKWAKSFGFGAPSGLDLGGEEEGLVPTIPWKRRHYETAIDKLWTPGDSIQLAIGQKDLLATPLQMTRFYALLANRGKLVTPYLVSDVEQPGTSGGPPVVRRRFAPVPPKQTKVSQAGLTAVHEGLRAATSLSYGTSVGVFGSFPVNIAGKTGTSERFNAELGDHIDQSWWCGYGPEWGGKGPIALCVVIENGGFGGEAAAPAALKVLERHYGVEAGVVAEVASD